MYSSLFQNLQIVTITKPLYRLLFMMEILSVLLQNNFFWFVLVFFNLKNLILASHQHIKDNKLCELVFQFINHNINYLVLKIHVKTLKTAYSSV